MNTQLKNIPPLLNCFTHLMVNAYSYYNAGLIIHKQYQEDEKILSENASIAHSQATFQVSYPLNKPRDHLFAIAIELLGKSIINEFEKLKSPLTVPDIAKYRHDFVKIHHRVKEIAVELEFPIERLAIGTNVILNKLIEIIKWGSRYHYDGDPINHMKKICPKDDYSVNPEANLCLLDDEVNTIMRLFCEYHELHRRLER